MVRDKNSTVREFNFEQMTNDILKKSQGKLKS